MADIIHLHGDPHEQTQALLPWYVNGTLEEAEAAIVEAHLAECDGCRAELEAERALGKRIAGVSIDLEQNWSAMRARIEARAGHSRIAALPFLHKRIAVGWAVAGQLAVACLVLVAAVGWRADPTPAAYHALGSAPTSGQGNVIILFQPDISERAMRDALSGVGARVVDGPMASGAFLLRVPAERRADALGRLRATAKVVLAEPLDAASAQ